MLVMVQNLCTLACVVMMSKFKRRPSHHDKKVKKASTVSVRMPTINKSGQCENKAWENSRVWGQFRAPLPTGLTRGRNRSFWFGSQHPHTLLAKK